MANQFYFGNEKGDYRGDGLIEVGFSVFPAINQRGGRSTLQGNGGNFYYYMGPGVGLPTPSNLQKNLSGPLGEVYGQFAFLMPSGGVSATLWSFYLGAVLVGRITAINQGANFVKLSFFRGDGTQIGPQTPDSFGPVNTAWQLVEFHLKPAASGGVLEIKVNGILEIQVLNGNITGPGGEVTFDNVRFGQDTGANIGYDDIMVNDTTGAQNNAWPNGVYCFPIFPVNVGTFSQLVNSYGNSVNNYQFINNIPAFRPNIGYVGTNTPGQKDTYKMAPPPLEFVGFSAVKVSMLATKNGPSIAHAQGVLIPNAEAEIDLPTAPGLVLPNGGFGWIDAVSETNPNNANNPYTAAEIGNLEAGIKFAA